MENKPTSTDTPTRDRVVRVFAERFAQQPQFLARAPGRVNLLGEHVDYNDGFVLPAAIDRSTWLAFSRGEGAETSLYAADFEEGAVFTPETMQEKHSRDGTPLPSWAHYPAGVAWSLQEAGLEAAPIQAAFASDVPRGAGLSSSASVEVAFAVAWESLGSRHVPPMELARICQRAENEYVGVNCGIMDQFASACGRDGKLLHLDCRSLEWDTLPLPDEVALVIMDTSVRRSLTGSAYNDRRAACELATRLLQADLPEIKALRDVDPADFDRLAGGLPPEAEKRARHVVEEVARARQAVDLLKNGAVDRFGSLMNDCHRSLRDLYEVSCPELDAMVGIAQALPGCYGARLTGAGFGGCAIALVKAEAVGSFESAVRAAYFQATGLTPAIYVTRASEGAGVEALE